MQTPIIPQPLKVEFREGFFTLNTPLSVQADKANQCNALYLESILKEEIILGNPHQGTGEKRIILKLDEGTVFNAPDVYILEVQPQQIIIRAADTQGVFYGIQSLRQLLPQDNGPRQIPCQVIEDGPRFVWRGFMLDEGRHFQGVQRVKDLLDMLALLKMNIFHWHLCEDQGWRIEIKAYPELTRTGARRPGTGHSLLDLLFKRHDGKPHAGFYTQAELREIVAYAAERHITIVPEIEMPGHSMASLSAYPQNGCTGGPYEVRTAFGVSQELYCPGKDSTLSFLENILEEVLEIFPGPYIHLGGDEAPKKRWKTCPDCQARMQAEGLQEVSQLQTWLINHMAAWLQERGRTPIGWNENLEPGLDPKMIIQYWAGDFKKVLKAAQAGRPLILSPFLDYYLDHSYSLTPLSRTYAYEPFKDGLEDAPFGTLLGVEAPLWTEFVPNRARLDYQVFPRLLAVAENGWTAAYKRSFKDFERRFTHFRRFLDKAGILYPSGREISSNPLKQFLSRSSMLFEQKKTAS